MQDTRLQTIAKAVSKRQERYQRNTLLFDQQSLLFQSEQAALTFLADHPDVLLLSVEEAAYVGRLVAQSCLPDAT